MDFRIHGRDSPGKNFHETSHKILPMGCKGELEYRRIKSGNS
ncbi:hypothetical protein LEP1GSC062_0901 [Leptospira alexanderi serovar Manhao 3 str. L 60]|uniref:Uncharacterized protein n=1 Tax=Leptospira alexanderi serovar Manhao 3 str. L 60 TaxID=1049759 RepID=V6I0Z1_9LEPT|nr:hypothetical protein LEP1GSC062_0901 [Leptospira alexanderi serovar Manhao 3 str. L 60]